MSKIASAFNHGKAFIAFITCGDPDLETTGRIVRAMVQARKEDPTKITADQAAFLAQKDLASGRKTMNAYLWYVCGQEYDSQNG